MTELSSLRSSTTFTMERGSQKLVVVSGDVTIDYQMDNIAETLAQLLKNPQIDHVRKHCKITMKIAGIEATLTDVEYLMLFARLHHMVMDMSTSNGELAHIVIAWMDSHGFGK